MRQQHIWLIAITGALAVVLLCAVIGLAGMLLLGRQITTAAAPSPTLAPPSPSPSEATTAVAEASPTAPTVPPPVATATASLTATTTSSSRSALTPTADASPAAVVYEDAFSDADSGWYTEEDIDGIGSINYADGAYRFSITEKDMSIWSTHRSFKLARLGDVGIEVDALQTDGYSDDTFGIICRVQGDNYYALEIGNDGWYSIGKVDSEGYTLLAAPEEDPATSNVRHVAAGAQTDEQRYRLRADCIGDTLVLYVDGAKVAEAHDSTYRSGGVGLTAYNYDAPRTAVEFDNVLISKP